MQYASFNNPIIFRNMFIAIKANTENKKFNFVSVTN